MGYTSEEIEDTLEGLDSLGVDVEQMEIMKQERTTRTITSEKFTDMEDAG